MSATSSSSEKVPVLQKGRKDIDAWERRFNDYCIDKKWRGIFSGVEEVPEELSAAELAAIPAASRYTAGKDRTRAIDDFNARSESAFAAICKAMQEDNLIYACSELDVLRNAVKHDPAAAHTLVMNRLRPSHVDAQMTAETKINTFALLPNESVPDSYQRLVSYVNCLEAPNRPDDSNLKRHMKRAIKHNVAANKLFMLKVETMMDKEPPITFDSFCQGLMRKHEEHDAEIAQEAALLTESSQQSGHHSNEQEQALYTKGKGGGRGGRGKGGRGGGRRLSSDKNDARIGALYYAQGGKGHDDLDNKRPFYRGGGRQDGGRGYEFNSYQGRGGGRGGGKGKSGGKGLTNVKFDGECHKCGFYGHKEANCFSKRSKY